MSGLDPQKIQKGDFVSLKFSNGTKVEGTVDIAESGYFQIYPFNFDIANGAVTYYNDEYYPIRATITSIGRSHPSDLKEEV